MKLDDAIEAFNAAEGDAWLEGSASEASLSISVIGSLGLEEASRLQGFLKNAIASLSPGQGLELNLSRVSYISSTGVGAIAMAIIGAKRSGIDLTIPAISPKAAAVLKALGILEYIKSGTCHE